jgi:hypothetical protein
MNDALSFGVGNAKLKADTATFSLPAGHTCPFARLCRSSADRGNGKIKDGPHCQFRCYAANSEALFKKVRESRWRNFDLLKSAGSTLQMAALIDRSIPRRKGNTTKVRFHQSGDFFNQSYFDAWLLVAENNPSLIFYGYTKAIPYWGTRLFRIPKNFHLVASYGGTHDSHIPSIGVRYAKVVYSEKEAADLNLPIDHDDSHVWNYAGNFAILLHGTQPAGTDASKAWQKIIKTGGGGYKTEYFKSAKKPASGSVIRIGETTAVKKPIAPGEIRVKGISMRFFKSVGFQPAITRHV